MLLDGLAQRYGLLPSEVMARADTLDVLVMDIAQSYRNYLEQQQARRSGQPPQAPDIPVNKLEDMIRKVRG